MILTTAEHKDQLQQQWQTFFLVHLEFFWFPRTASQILGLTQTQAHYPQRRSEAPALEKNSDKNNNNTSLAVFTHYLSPLLVVMVMMMTNASVGFISSPSAAPAPRNSEAQVTSCFLEQ